MGDFSNQFRKIIHENNIRIYKLVEVLGLERSTIYKVMSGKRLIGDVNVVKKFIEYIGLDEAEAEELIKNYYKDKLGKEKYEYIESVCKFLNNNYEKKDDYKVEMNLQTKVVEGKHNLKKIVEALFSSGYNDIKVLLNHILEVKYLPINVNSSIQVKILLSIDANKNNELSRAMNICEAVPHIKNIKIKCNYNGYENLQCNFLNFTEFFIANGMALLVNSSWENGLILHDKEQVQYIEKLFDIVFENGKEYIEFGEIIFKDKTEQFNDLDIYCTLKFAEKYNVLKKYNLHQINDIKDGILKFPNDKCFIFDKNHVIILYENVEGKLIKILMHSRKIISQIENVINEFLEEKDVRK